MVFVIFASALLAAIQTELSHPENNSTNPVISILQNCVLACFTAEMLLKIIAEGDKPFHYFNSAWNTFDFFVVAACFFLLVPYPQASSMSTMVRLLRLLRVLKVIRAFPELQIIVASIINSFKSIMFATLIIFIFFYLYANIGVIIFRSNDPEHFGMLHLALITLFRISTLDGWGDVM